MHSGDQFLLLPSFSSAATATAPNQMASVQQKKLIFYWLAFSLLEGAVQAAGGEKAGAVLLHYGFCALQYQSAKTWPIVP